MSAKYPPNLRSQLEEMLAGFAAQSTPPAFPDVTVAELTRLKSELTAAEEQSRAAEAAAELAREKRDQVGTQAKVAYVKMAGYLRNYYKGQPPLLAQFGLEPKKSSKKPAQA